MILYYVLDTETTGLKVGYHEINQISVIRMDPYEQITVNIAVDHPRRASPEALKVQRKTIDDLKKGIDKEDAVRQVTEFLIRDEQSDAHRCIVGHNVQFDRKFCHQLWDDVGKVFPAHLWLCTKALAQKYAKRFGSDHIAEAQMKLGMEIKRTKNGALKPKYGLNDFMQGIGITPKTGAHSATVDTENTLTLLDFVWESGVEYVSAIKRFPHHEEKQEIEYYDDFE
jgi:DNA polymerase III epsilon subunit-like protein